MHNRGPEAARLHAAADALVPQHLVVGRRTQPKPALREPAHGVDRGLASRARRRTLYCDGDAASCCSPRTRRNTQRLFGVSRTRRPYVKDAFHRYVVHGRARRGEPGADRAPRRRRTTCSTCPPAAVATIRLRLRRPPAGGASRSARLRRRCSQRGSREADEFYAAHHAAVAQRGRARASSPGPRRHALDASSSTTSTSTRWLEGARARTRCSAARKRARAQRRVVPHVERRRHLDARQVGVPLVRGLGPRVPRRRAVAGRLRLRQGAAAADAARAATCTRTARSRPTSGTSATSTRRCTPGRRSSSIESRSATSGASDLEFLERSFQKLMLNFTWWVNRKDRRAATCSRAASSASTTSASSTAARRCRPAATSSRPTAPRGWRSSARTCWRSRSSWPMHDPTYEEMALKFLEHFLWIAYAMDRVGEHHDEHVGRRGRLLLRRAAAARRPAPRGSRSARWSGLLPLCASTVFEAEMLARASRGCSS